MVDINLTDPQSNQILVYNELLQQFENTDLTPNIIKDFTYVESAMNIGEGVHVFNDNINGILRFKSITGSNGINVRNNGVSIDIEFSGNATHLGGLPRQGFVQKSNNLNDVDAVQARSNLEVMSVHEARDSFLLAHASNIPDNDNYYDLGSNGNRFANMFAVTFHGNATSASMAYKLHRNDAREGDVLVWRNAANKWVPEAPLVNTLGGLHDVDLTGLHHETILVFNGVRNKWEPVPTSIFSGGGDGSGIGQVENIGDGIGIHSSTLGSTIMLRSISGGNDKVHVDTNFQGDEVVITVDVPRSTDDLPEGDTNRYYRTLHFLRDMERISIQDLAKVDKNITPTVNQAPVWNGDIWEWRTVPVDLTNTDHLEEGSTNLYFTDARGRQSVANFFNDGQALLRHLGDTSFSNPANGDSLVYNNSTGMWGARKLRLLEMSDVTANSIVVGQSIVWDGGRFVNYTVPVSLEDLNESDSSLHFNIESFNRFFEHKTTLDFADKQDDGYLFLNTQNLKEVITTVSINDLGDVDTTGIANGGLLAWDSSRGEFVPITQDSIEVTTVLRMADLTDVDTQSAINIKDGQMLAFHSESGFYLPVDPFKNIVDADDVDTTGMQRGDTLVWDGEIFTARTVAVYQGTPQANDLLMYNGSVFVPINRNQLVESLDSLGDVNIFGLNDGDILQYNATLQMFENTRPLISSMDDVDLNNVQNGDILVYDSVNNKFATAPVRTSFSDLNDVDISSISEGQGVKWDGDKFIPHDFLTVEGSSGGNPYDLIYKHPNSGDFVLGDFDTANNILTTKKGTNSVLGWNGTRLEYTNLSLLDLADVSKTSGNLEAQYVLKGYLEGGELKYRLEPAATAIKDLSDVASDVDPEDGFVLTYDAIRGEYVPKNHRVSTGNVTGGIVEFIAEAGQVQFNVDNTGEVLVWANGILLPRRDVNAINDTHIVLSQPRQAGDTIRVMVIQDPNYAEPDVSGLYGKVTETTQEPTAAPFYINIDLDTNLLMVWVNGVLYPTNKYASNTVDNRIVFYDDFTETANITVLELGLPT